MQAQATRGQGASTLDGAQVRAALSGDIRAVIRDVNRSVLGEVDSMMVASGITRTLEEAKEAVSPILRSRSNAGFKGEGYGDDDDDDDGEEEEEGEEGEGDVY